MLGLSMQQGNIYYAYTSLSKENKNQIVWIQFTSMDNDPQRFWNIFIDGLSVWDLQFTQQQHLVEIPTGERLEPFISAFTLKLTRNPLMLIVNNMQYVHNSQVASFLHTLLKLDLHSFFVVLLSSNELDIHAAIEEDIQANKYRFFLEEEERAYYKEQGLLLDAEEFSTVRSFTEGWINALVVLAKHQLPSADRKTVFGDFSAYLYRWIEEEYLKFNPEERQVIACLTLLEEFPAGLVQKLTGWDGDTTLRVLDHSPFIRLAQRRAAFILSPIAVTSCADR